MILALGESLEEVTEEQQALSGMPAVFLTDSAHAEQTMNMAGMVYEGEIKVSEVGFCKLETQQECLAGSLCIPKLLDVLGSRYRILFFVNQKHIVIVDDDDFSLRLIQRIKRRKSRQGRTKEIFLYNFITEFMKRDLQILAQYERRLICLEEDVMNVKLQGFQSRIIPNRNEIL